MRITICFLLLFLCVSNQIMAQDFFNDTITTPTSKNEFISSFKKKIAIDPQNYNITIDYAENNYNTLIFSGTAYGLGNLTATNNTINAINGILEFKIEIKYQEEIQKWLFKPQKLVFTYKAANSISHFSYLPTSILDRVENELRVITIYGPQFKIDSFFFSQLNQYKNEKDRLLTLTNNAETNKKDRKKAKKEYEQANMKYKIYNDVYKEALSVMTCLKIYYF